MSRHDVELYKRHLASTSVLLHMIGTTETGWIRRYCIDQATPITGNAVPVGYAVPDTAVLLLDDSGNEAGGGQVGEIAVQSRYLAAGYWRQPALTRAKFRLCAAGDGQQLYRTGDLGRMEPDGRLVHLGRQDFQVKVRGYRVEIGEVEAVLLQHPAVKEVVAVGRAIPSGDTRLVAYVVPTTGQMPVVPEFRSFLQEKLPDYMLPSTFVMLPALPYTPHGKLDYGARPAPERRPPEFAAAYVAPKSAMEHRIAAVWQEVLGLEKVGVHDNFFDLGGHSLLLTQVHSRLQDILQKDIPIVDMFKHPTIHALVVYVGHPEGQPDCAVVVVLCARDKLGNGATAGHAGTALARRYSGRLGWLLRPGTPPSCAAANLSMAAPAVLD